ncbi:hypothetical protein [Segniliparus rugosus]|uniref:Lipoprotein n=1 Tax=Segniliparus rugosus (strain ATCC BAA-974 / DSM 45345 / CCUG 50838 / CIP 108380 / JCM 13579 / CDC 945) TaxID=679197 RepID=E5XLF7_SEGRC|nr:hypothetical protein [Segniliparus rugosus]EFV14803.2 hypothetical protein HMPREF9336_00326 [Segniliparus rugosus ATCC BAA-974]
MRWNRLAPPLVVLAALAGGCSAPAPPSDPSSVPASFALARQDFPEGYEFHDDRDLRELDVVELGAKKKDRRLPDYSKLTLDHLSTEQQACALLMDVGRRPTYHTAAGPVAPAPAHTRSSLGIDQRVSTTLVFVVTTDPVPLDQYRQALAGCGRFSVKSERIGPGQGGIVPAEAPDGGLAYTLEAQLQAPSGIEYAFSRVLIAVPVGRDVVFGSASRTTSVEKGKEPLDQTTLRAMLHKLVDKVKAG